jgi:predicted kinase
MTQPSIIIIHGEAAVGKTSLAQRLASDFDLPYYSKDYFSEMMYDRVDTKFNAPSPSSKNGAFSTISLRALGIVAEEFAESGQSVIIEAPFHADLLQPSLDRIAQIGAKTLQIYCFTDQVTRQARYDERLKSGRRHPGHGDRSDHKIGAPSHPPLPIDDTIKVDMTTFDDEEYTELLSQIEERTEMVRSDRPN